jgi:Na+-translocating ferredoxin:NAD+ oxidoreductase subunit C
MSYNFYGGVHPSAFKTLTSDRPAKRVFIPKKVVLPLSQHVGSPSQPVVAAGDAVTVGQKIAESSGFISANLHATISGRVSRIINSTTPTQPRAESIIVESEGGEVQDFAPIPNNDVEDLSKERLIDIVKEAGIVGLGGAAFPAHVKLSIPKNKTVDSFIVNGAECEPYLTCDHRIMMEKTKEIFRGIDIVCRILGVKNAYVAIEDNKRSAIYAMERALAAGAAGQAASVEIVKLKTRYPQGAEKQMIKAVLDRTVPAGGLPMDVECVVHNAQTVFAIYEAVYFGKPLIKRMITITGSSVKEPVNIWVRIGTLLSDLVSSFGGFVKEPAKVIVGGPMMGIAQYTMDVPITKGTSGVVFLPKEYLDESTESVCIRCGRCIEACPMGLAPTTLMYRVKKEQFAEAKEMGILNCYECAACAYTCPAKIPLLDYMKYGKSKVTVV